MSVRRIHVIDSHTGGEPTRIVLEGGPPLGNGSLQERLARFRDSHDRFRSAIVNEPRGSDVLVGAMLCEPSEADCVAGVVFFNNVGYLGMCGHGTIGLMVTLGWLGRIQPGRHRIDTPVGIVEAAWHGGAEASVINVPSYRSVKDLVIEVPGIGRVSGDIAWGGNWFFLVKDCALRLSRTNCQELTELARHIRAAVNGCGHPEVDHVEIFDSSQAGADAKNFVLCPGGAYDRSPCGTGTSAKLACLAADGVLPEGSTWVQESVIGSTFRARYRWLDRAKGTIIPTITGTAYVTGESTLLLDETDPFCWGVPPA